MAKKKAETGLPENTHVLEPRVYEIGYLLVPTLREEDLDAHVTELRDMIAQHKGIIISEEAPQLIDLAYDMVKVINNKNHTFHQGYFGWIKFDLMPSDVNPLEKACTLYPDMIRFLMTKTVRENTIFSKKLVYKTSARSADEHEDVVAPVEEEPDKAHGMMNLDLAVDETEKAAPSEAEIDQKA